MSKIKKPTNSNFDSSLAMELANLIERAYQQFNHFMKNPGISWNPEDLKILIGSTTCDLDLDNPSNSGRVEYQILSVFKIIEFTFTSAQEVPFGFIVQRELENGILGIFIVFRGTLTTDEWYHNSRFQQVDFLEDKELGQVSEGFNTVYTRSVDENYIKNAIHRKLEKIFTPDEITHFIGTKSLENTVIETLKKCPNKSQIFVTGHSLGGALATLAAVHIVKCFITSNSAFKKPILYTYASPRVGDPVFASHFKDLECYRIANSEDLVVSVPPAAGKLRGPEMNGEPIIDSDNRSTLTMEDTPARELNVENIKKLADEFKRDSSNQVYEHVGEPIYFTDQRGFISTNHNMFYIYRQALPDSGNI
jgi:triacylglycerol lipase